MTRYTQHYNVVTKVAAVALMQDFNMRFRGLPKPSGQLLSRHPWRKGHCPSSARQQYWKKYSKCWSYSEWAWLW